MSLYTVRLGSLHVDRVQLDTSATRPVVSSRVPPPPLAASVESTLAETFNIPDGTAYTFETKGTLVRAIADSTLDSITKSLRLIHLENGAFTGADVAKTLRITGSLEGNNADYTIATVVDTKNVYVEETPVCNEGPGTLLSDANSDGVWDTISETITFVTADFVDPTHATAEEVVTAFNADATNATARLAREDQRVRFVSSSGHIEFTSLPASDPLGLDSLKHEPILYVAEKDQHISFIAQDTGASGFGRVRVWVQTDDELVAVYDSQGPVTAPGWSVSATAWASPDALVNDNWSFDISHTTDFVSEETVLVRVTATTADAAEQTYEYEFAVEDYEQPQVDLDADDNYYIKPWTTTQLRVRFSEPMEYGEGDTSILSVREISGRLAYYARYNTGTESVPIWKYNVVEAPAASFVTTDVGLFLSSINARYTANRGCWSITERLSASLVCVNASLVDETPADPLTEVVPRAFVGPYRLVYTQPALPDIMPACVPAVIAAELPDELSIHPMYERNQFVELTLHTDLSPSVSYALELVRIADLSGNEIDTTPTYTFASWAHPTDTGRSFSLWDMIPNYNKDRDNTRDLEKLIRCADDQAQVHLHDVDEFAQLLDPLRTREVVIDTLLAHLGCPFSFVSALSYQKKRELIPLLVPMYKQRGTDVGIEDAVAFFVGKLVNVAKFDIPSDTWELGVSRLDYNTYLGPSQSRVRYSFYVDHVVDLTTSEQAVIEEIIHFMRPAHTHFIGFRQVQSL